MPSIENKVNPVKDSEIDSSVKNSVVSKPSQQTFFVDKEGESNTNIGPSLTIEGPKYSSMPSKNNGMP